MFITYSSKGWRLIEPRLLSFPPLPQTYNVTNLLEDIKGLYKVAGFKGQPVCFLFTDAEVKDEAFLEYINQLLMTGEVAGEPAPPMPWLS